VSYAGIIAEKYLRVRADRGEFLEIGLAGEVQGVTAEVPLHLLTHA
jgi:hypothetical protein